MRGVNKAIILGTMGKDPEIRYLPSGKAVASFSVATSEKWKDTNGDMQEKTEWHACSAFDKLAEIIGQYCKKGSKVYCEGSIHTRKYQDKATGTDRYSTEIKVNQLQMLDSKPAEDQAPKQRPAQRAAAPAPMDDFDDSLIPF